MTALLKRLQAQLITYDEDAFIILANRGLLRRAKKDLEKSAPRIEAQEERILVYMDRHEVELDDRGPARARCSCPASGVCHHVLCACLALAAHAAEDTQPPSLHPTQPVHTQEDPHRTLLSVTAEELEHLAGRGGLRWAIDFAAKINLEFVTMGGDGYVLIAFSRPRMSFRYMGGGLEAMVTDYKGRDREKLIAAAVLTYQRACGMLLPPSPSPRRRPDAPALAASEEHAAPPLSKLRRAVLRATAAIVCECIEIGLSHLSQTVQQRLTTLSVSARGARLHRLALMLRAMADQVEMLLQHEAGADEERLFDDLALTHALVYAMLAATDDKAIKESPALPIHLVGEARSAYEEIGKLELAGLGAYPWRTPSGYTGLTLVFWCADEERWYSYTEARPEFQGGFDPIGRYDASVPWAGVMSPRQLMGRRFTLLAARANRFGRISSSEKTAAVVHAEVSIEDILARGVTNWDQLSQRPTLLSMLAEHNPLDDLIVLRPSELGPPLFDPTRQSLTWPLLDEKAKHLDMLLDYSPYTEHAIERIEALDKEDMKAIRGIVARLRRHHGGLFAEPISLLGYLADRPVDVLSFDPGTSKTTVEGPFARFKAAFGKQDKQPAPSIAPPQSPSSVQRFLGPLAQESLRVAERGLGTGSLEQKALPASVLVQIERCKHAGLDIFDTVASRSEQNPSEILLGLRYVILQCYRAAGIMV